MHARKLTAALAAVPLLLASSIGVAHADNIQDTIADNGAGITLVAGSTTGGTAAIRVVGNNSDGAGTDPGCNWDAGETALVLNVITPGGVTAAPDPLSIKDCGVDVPVTFTAGASAVSGIATVSIVSSPAGGGGYNNQVSIPITVTQPAKTNTKPVVSLSGVTDGASYVTGTVPAATCSVTDAEDGPVASFPAALSALPASGLGSQTATCDHTDEGGLAADTASATYTVVAPPNTKPTVTVSGVTEGASYEIGTALNPTCDVTDAEDGNSSHAAPVSGSLSHGLGQQTATCDYTDKGGLAADTATATYTIVDTGNPTITHTVSPANANAAGWYSANVAVDFSCADSGSGIDTCTGDTTLTEGADQSVTGTATDWAGNTATDTVSGINIDTTVPTVGFTGGPGASYVFGNDPAAPTCDASDGLSGLDTCVITGGGSSVGSHTYTATATDNAGNTATATLNYQVLAWTLKGFYSPVDMGGTWNTVKGGSTVPMKFELFAGSTELTSTTAVKSFAVKAVTCPNSSATVDEIELVTTGGTSLRYDATGGQFIQNWQTPKKPGACYAVTMTAQDGSAISANFQLK